MDNLTPEERDKAFQTFVKRETGVFRFTDDVAAHDVQVVPTGALSLDVALGVGGLPTGRVVEMYGPEGSGKTSILLSAIAEAQKLGGYCGFVDAEHALSPERAEAFGVDMDRLALYQPDNGEDGLEMVRKMCQSGSFTIVGVDSVAALTPKAEVEGTIEDNHVGVQARMMSQGLRMITGVIAKSKTMVVFVNQLRESMNAYGNPEVTPGGRALKFYSSVRLEVRSPKSAQIKDGKDVIGQNVRVKVTKNKVAPPFKTCSFDLYYRGGIAAEGALLEVAADLGIITNSGAWFYDGANPDIRLGQGRDAVRVLLAEHPQLAASYTDRVYAVLAGHPDPGADVDALIAADDAGEVVTGADGEPMAAAA